MRERSSHGALREVEIDALIARARLKGVHEMVMDPESKGIPPEQRKTFDMFFNSLVRRFDHNGDGIIASTEIEALIQKLCSKVAKTFMTSADRTCSHFSLRQ